MRKLTMCGFHSPACAVAKTWAMLCQIPGLAAEGLNKVMPQTTRMPGSISCV